MVSSNLSLLPIVTVGGMRLLEMICILFIVIHVGGGVTHIGLKETQIFSGLIKGAIWSAGGGVIVGIVFIVMLLNGLNPVSILKAPLPETDHELMLYFMVGGFIGPITEEFFFRGVLYSFFRQWGMVIAVLFSTLIFVLCHPISGRLPLIQISGGLLFAFAFEFEKNLMVPIIVHIVGNITIYSILYLIEKT